MGLLELGDVGGPPGMAHWSNPLQQDMRLDGMLEGGGEVSDSTVQV